RAPRRPAPARRRGSSAIDGTDASLERRSDLELQSLDSIASELADGLGDGQPQRPDRRNPGEAYAGRCAHVAEADLFVLAKDVAGVHEAEQAQRTVVAGTRERGDHFGVQGDLLRAADRGPRDV